MGTIALALHVTAAAILVGPQILMFLAVVPATWLIEDDERLKRGVTRVVAARFGMLATISIVVLIVTGLYQYYTIVPVNVRESPEEYVFGPVFSLKMIMFVVTMVLIGIHMRYYGKRIAGLSDRVIAIQDDPFSASTEEANEVRIELERARQKSFGFSVFILGASLVTMWLGVALGHESFAWSQLNP
ncbi:MAG: hypothetical protein WCI61_09740 [Chloroflexota bacterium]